MVLFFVKRQITKHTLKSGRGPHATIGANAPKVTVCES